MPVWYGYGEDGYGTSPYGSVEPSVYITKTESYELLYGYKVEWRQQSAGTRFPLDTDIMVLVRADNEARKGNINSEYYKFRTRNLLWSNLRATITSTPGVAVADLGATLTVNSPHYEWGKTMTLVLTAQDNSGNTLGPITITYTLENN